MTPPQYYVLVCFMGEASIHGPFDTPEQIKALGKFLPYGIVIQGWPVRDVGALAQESESA